MLALEESFGAGTQLTPAREMSDGLLRFVAIATALLTSNRGLDIDQGLAAGGPRSSVLLVIEELENGLHPSQAGRVLQLIEEVGDDDATQVMVTTHSPALLNAMTGQLNRSVIVCYRDGVTGHSRLTRLPELPGYAEAMAAGLLGDVMSQGKLAGSELPGSDFDRFNRLLGSSDVDVGQLRRYLGIVQPAPCADCARRCWYRWPATREYYKSARFSEPADRVLLRRRPGACPW